MQRRVFILVGIVVSVTSALFAGKLLYMHWAAPRPLVMRCSDYLHDRPDAIWVDLQDCNLDYARAVRVFWKSGQSPSDDLFVPVVENFGDRNVVLLFKSPDDEAKRLNSLPGDPTPAERVAAAQIIAPLLRHRRITGLLHTEFDTDHTDRDAIVGSGLSLGSSWNIVEQAKPTPFWLVVPSLIVPLLFAAYLVWLRWWSEED